MIYVSKEIPANAPGQHRLSRSEIWKGLVMKADNVSTLMVRTSVAPQLAWCVSKRSTFRSRPRIVRGLSLRSSMQKRRSFSTSAE